MHVNVDTLLVDKMVNEVKSQGVFDQFRKDSMADVDTKPAYQNLRQRVESTVGKFLANQTWRQDLNKNQLREKLRKHITEAGFLDTGVERIVDQVVNPKISSVFQPKIEAIAYKYLGIEKPHSSPPRPQSCNGKIDIKTDLLPTDLEAVSPDSDKTNPKSECKEDIFNDSTEDKNEEFESPPFEPIGPSPVKKEDSNHSQLSGISGLTSQDSASSEHKESQPKFAVNADTQQESVLSEVSSNSRLSIITNDENSSKPTVKESAEVDISEEAQMPKFNDCYNSNESKVVHNLHFDIKREDIKFEGTERNADKHLYESDHSNENYAKTEIPLKEFEKIEQSIECNVKSEFQIESESNANIKVETEIKGEDVSGDSISNQISSMFEEKNEYAAVDMSCSESDTSQSRNSFRLRYNNSAVDLKLNEIQNGNIVPPTTQIAYMPPQPPSPPNDEVFAKPPSPFDKVIPIPTTLPAKKDFHQGAPLPFDFEASSNYPPAVNDYLMHGPPHPVTDYSLPRPPSFITDYSPSRLASSATDYSSPRPPSSVTDYLPPRPPSPATDYLPPRPPSPGIDCLPPRPPSPEIDCLPPKPPSPIGDCLPPRPPSGASDYSTSAPPPRLSDYSSPRPPSPMPRPQSPIANRFASIPSPPAASDYLASRLPPTTDYLVPRPPSHISDYLPSRPPPATEYLAPPPPIPASDYLAPKPPPTADYLVARPPSPRCNNAPPKSSTAIDYIALRPLTSSVSDAVGPRFNPITDYIAARPPLPTYDYLTPRPSVVADEYIAPRPHTPVSDYLAPRPPPTIDYFATRPPSPPCDYSALRPPSPPCDYSALRPPATTNCPAPRPPAGTDYLAPRPPSPVSVYSISRPPPTIECLIPRPPSPKTECFAPRTPSPVSEYLPPRPPSPVSDYIPPRPPSPPHEILYRRPPSPVSQKPVFKPPSPVNQDLPSRPPSPPPQKNSYARPGSPLKSKFMADESFSESATEHNAGILKPPSPPPPLGKSDMSTKDTSFSEAETSQSTNSSESKNKEISIPSKSDESKIWDILPLKPPSTPPLPKSNSRNESRSKSSSYHHKSKSSSRDDKNSYKSHSHRSSSSSSRNHSSPSSSHHHRSDDKRRSNSSSRHKSSKSDKDKSREKKKDDHTSARHKERRRKSTDSNDGDNHRQRSRHSSHHGDDKSRSMKESTSNSNSSGNFSSNTNSNSGTSCHDASQKKSKSGRSYRNKEQRRSSSRDESLKYFVVNTTENQSTEALLAQLKEAIHAKQSPIYLLDCENDTREIFENASHKVIEIHVTNEYDPAKSNVENRKSRIVSKNDNLKKPDMEISPMLTSENTPAGKNTLKNNHARTISRKRKTEDSITVSYRMFTGDEKDLIIDCLEYNKTKKIFRPAEDHIEVSPASYELSVSSKENEFGGMAKKPSSLNTKNGKHIKADGMEKIEKLPNNGFKASSQRYSSEDLYKPRPLSQRPRRREMIAESPII